ncbi:11165_t:CDS:2, partial [Acaulospora morrowiae]
LSVYGDELKLEIQFYPPQPYLGFPPNVTTDVPRGTTVYHVTKEFGGAVVGRLGHTVTALAKGQTVDKRLNINIIMPHYSHLNELYPHEDFAKLSIDVQDGYGNWAKVTFSVRRINWNFTDSSDQSTLRRNHVYLIGRAIDFYPFSLAFRTTNSLDIHSTQRGLPQEWKDIYFCKAAAELIIYLNEIPETSLFSPSDSRGVDIVHLHGATNAFNKSIGPCETYSWTTILSVCICDR